MKSYLIASLLFYVSGVISISSNNATMGCVWIALGCTFFAVALNRRKKEKSSKKDDDK